MGGFLKNEVRRNGFVHRRRQLSEQIRIRQTLNTQVEDESEDEDHDTLPPSHVKPSSFTTRRRKLYERQAAPAPEEEDEEAEEESSSSSDSDSDSDSDSEVGEEAEGEEDDVDSISSGSSSDSDEESEEEEVSTPGQPATGESPATSIAAPPGGQTGGFRTIVPGAGAAVPTQSTEASVTAAPSQTEVAPSQSSSEGAQSQNPSAVSSAASVSSAVTAEEPLADSELTTTLSEIASRTQSPGQSQITSGDPAGAASTGEADLAGQVDEAGGGGSRGKAVGIVIGTIALTGLLILISILIYRRRRNQKEANNGHLERLPDEKAPPDAPTFSLTPPAPIKDSRRQSSIMDEAMGAYYQAENQARAAPTGAYQREDGEQDYYIRRDTFTEKQGDIPIQYEGGLTASQAPVTPISPLATNWPAAGDFAPSPPLQSQASNANKFQLYPATAPPPGPPPPPPPPKTFQPQFQQVDAPPGAMFPGRLSFAKTELTAESEGTWGTFSAERARANGGKLPLKERMFGY